MIPCPRVRQFLALVLSFLLTPLPVWAFEIETHSDITGAAFDRSAVSDAFQDLGVDPQRPLRGGVFRGPRPPRRWLQQGSRDEDDTISASFARYRNHFYDPVNNRGLTATAFGVIPIRGERAPDWALEAPEEFFTQAFSYRDARLAFLTALIAGAPLDRETALASTFEILGHVIHPLQDMASPPHTRNDIHGGFGFGPTSLFERYLDQEQIRPRLNFGGTPVRLDLPRHYWTTGDGRGLAEFVNRNFVSEGTNFTTRVEGAIGGGYPNPALRLGADDQGRPFETTLDIQTQLEPGLRDRNGNLIDGSVTFFANKFQDPISGAALRNERMTTLSLFDRELERKGAALVFTLNRYNIEAQAAFLIPRAVGYSAGLLDYFFRGRVNAFGNDLSFTFENLTDEAMDGTFTLYYDDNGDVRRPVPGASWTRALAPAGAVEDLSLSPPSGPLPKEPGRYMLVFRGALGSEQDAVVGRQVFIEPVMFARLIKRSDGTPHRGAAVQAIDVQSGEVLASELTDQDGRARLGWRPGRTVLFIPRVNVFPMYWAGGSAFSSTIEGGRVIQVADLDPQREVTIPIPLIAATWPERIEACTEVQLFTHQPNGVFRQSVPLGPDRLDFVSVTYGVNLITFIRDDNG